MKMTRTWYCWIGTSYYGVVCCAKSRNNNVEPPQSTVWLLSADPSDLRMASVTNTARCVRKLQIFVFWKMNASQEIWPILLQWQSDEPSCTHIFFFVVHSISIYFILFNVWINQFRFMHKIGLVSCKDAKDATDIDVRWKCLRWNKWYQSRTRITSDFRQVDW